MTVISVRCLGRGAEPLLPMKEALASYLGRTPDQIRRTLARAAPHLLDAVPFIGAAGILSMVGFALLAPQTGGAAPTPMAVRR